MVCKPEVELQLVKAVKDNRSSKHKHREDIDPLLNKAENFVINNVTRQRFLVFSFLLSLVA